MKALAQRFLQRLLGYDTYLWYFTLYKLRTLKWDQNENDFFHFLCLIPKESYTLDIGANLGLMSFHLAKKSKKTYAFEPMPSNLKILKKVKLRYKLNNLEILENALGNENKSIQLVLPIVEGVKKQGLSHVVDTKMTEFNEGNTIDTLCKKLDDMEELKDINVAAIKIDVENFEYEVFQGSNALLKRCKPVIYCELWDNQNRKDCFDYLDGLGYKRYVYQEGNLNPIKGNPSDIQNFFFIHPVS